RKHGRLNQTRGQIDTEIAESSCRRERLSAHVVVDQLTDSPGERDDRRCIIMQRYERHLLMIAKRILIQDRPIRTNGRLDEGCVEIDDVSNLILRKSVSDRPVNIEIFEQPDGVRRQRSNSITSRNKL